MGAEEAKEAEEAEEAEAAEEAEEAEEAEDEWIGAWREASFIGQAVLRLA